MHRLIDISLRNKFLVLILTAVMVGVGIYSVRRLPIENGLPFSLDGSCQCPNMAVVPLRRPDGEPARKIARLGTDNICWQACPQTCQCIGPGELRVKMRNTRSEHNESASPPIATGSQTWQHVACGPAPDIRARRSFVRLMLRELDTNDTYRLPLRHRSNTQRA